MRAAYARPHHIMDTDCLVLGSGLAGLALALKVADRSKVLICTKTDLKTTNSAMAQGGIAAVMSSEDSFDRHVEDTLNAGAGLCDPQIVRQIIEQGPERIGDLMGWGVRFDLDEFARMALTREGGHSMRRILHVADHTGQEVHAQVLKRVLAHPNIEVLENHYALDLILNQHVSPREIGPRRCLGAYVLNRQTGDVFPVLSPATFLATGGAGKVYLYTSNWSGATGDGIAMAHRAGARVSNLEFMQFHPTCLFHPLARNFLISEALRGEGGELVDTQGEAFMARYHPMGSLAPRDIVARSIDAEMKRTGAECVFLDIRARGREYLSKRFPVIYNKCLQLGIDMATQPLPVVPAAHYLCGGVLTDVHGATDVAGLYALGETACTGLHGANRLASNSLLECLVVSHCAAQHYLKQPEVRLPREVPEWPQTHLEDPDEMIVIHHMWDEIRRLMWNYVGIVRTNRRLQRAEHRLETIQHEIAEYYSSFKTHADIEELRNIALVAELTVKCALSRKESRGIHFNLDYPDTLPIAKDSIF
ncbi:MAG: L-aspartate oxidase [Bdellovibrionales bacterium]